VTADGWIIADSRRVIATEQRGESTAHADYFEPFQADGRSSQQLKDTLGEGASGHGTIDFEGKSHRIAWQTVKHWTLVGLEEEQS
jgi:hypothetical protein